MAVNCADCKVAEPAVAITLFVVLKEAATAADVFCAGGGCVRVVALVDAGGCSCSLIEFRV